MTPRGSRSTGASRLLRAAALCCAALAAGCATGPNPRDPWEPFNRKMFAFNEALDKNVAQPVAKAYVAVTPPLVRTGISNFFNNAYDFVTSVNCLLQLKGECAAESFLRFSFNTVFGLAGLLDIAGEAGIERRSTDFGITLGRWGVSSGPYLVLPLLGPSNVRDGIAGRLTVDRDIDPIWWGVDEVRTRNQLIGLRLLDTRASLLRVSQVFDDAAIDKYTFTREAYMQRRRNLIYDGNPPDDEDDEQAGAPAAAASVAQPPAPAGSQPGQD